MRRTKIAIITLAASGLVLAGCSTGDDDSTTPQSTVESTPETSEEPPSAEATSEEPTEDDGGGGEASGDLVAWAGEFCGAIAPLEEQVSGDAFSDIQPSDPTDQAAVIEQFKETFGALGPIFADARDAIEGVGAPPIDGGDEIYDSMLQVLSTAADAFGQFSAQLETLDPNDPEALTSLAPLLEDLGPEFEAAGAELEAAFNQPEMQAAFEEAPECEGLDITS